MIVEVMLEDGERVLHYSNLGLMMRQQQTDILYAEAVDLVPCAYTYEETDIPIEEGDAAEEASAVEIVDILLGEDNNDN